ncbi:ribonuclease T [uncultured Rhodoblastus sp.]|uniref:ribonuclease T2 family protein n=1 Tax=uncultured Rhodoblastus sp. TaxID=543037 RepID=UPI0025E00F55|nr:ribonuclease T [uncultured Rhodoblastus sp.]
MKSLFAMALLVLAATPAFGLDARDCLLDRCADQRTTPETDSQGFGRPSPPRDEKFNSRRGGAAPAGDFDFYVLALSWSPSFCAEGGAQRSRGQCAPGANPGFVVHGLWPQYFSGYPSQCRGDGFLPFSVLAGLDGLYPDQGLARHEWRQHGVCSGKTPAGYFADVRAARDAVAIPSAFKALEQDREFSPLAVQRAFIEANRRLRPGMMAVTCRRGVLQEARLCLSRDLRDFVACPQVARASCRSQSLVVPAGG